MRSSPKPCCKCGKTKPVWKSHKGEKYCKHCWSIYKPPKKIRAVTPKKLPLQKTYQVLRKSFLQIPVNSCCNGSVTPECTGCREEYLTIHHKKGRGKYFLDISTWCTLCSACHRWVHDHSTEAYELGLLIHRNHK